MIPIICIIFIIIITALILYLLIDASSKELLQKTKINMECIKLIIEIIIIPLSAYVLYITFINNDSPESRRSINLESKLTIDFFTPEKNHVEYLVNFKNIGNQLRIDSTKFEYWLIPQDSILSKDIYSIDSLITKIACHNSLTITNPISGIYSPNQESNHPFTFIIDHDEQKTIIVKSTFYYLRGNERDTTFNYTYSLHAAPSS